MLQALDYTKPRWHDKVVMFAQIGTFQLSIPIERLRPTAYNDCVVHGITNIVINVRM